LPLLFAPLAIDEEGFGAALGRLLLLGRLLFEAVRLSPLPAEGLGEAATGPLGLALPLLFAPLAIDEEGFGAALGRLLLLDRLLFEAVRLFPLLAEGLGGAATGPRGAALEGREVTLEEGFGALEGPLALLLLLLFEGFAAGRGVGAEEILGALLGGLLGRAAGRASGCRLFLLLLLVSGR